MTVGELVGAARTPLVVAVIVLLLAALGVLGRWLASSLWRSLRAALTRQGERLGALEQEIVKIRGDARLEAVRRFQLEATLMRRGFELPPWPDSPDVDEDQDDESDGYTTELATQHFTRNRLRRPAP